MSLQHEGLDHFPGVNPHIDAPKRFGDDSEVPVATAEHANDKKSHEILCIIYFLIMILFSTHTCHNLHLCNKT